MIDAQTDIGKAHTCDILPKRHLLAADSGHPAFCLRNGFAQVGRNDFYGLQVEHIGKLPSRLGGVALDCVGKRIHAGSCGKPSRHRSHHIGVDHGDIGDIVDIHAHKFANRIGVGNHIVDSYLCSRARSSGNRDGKGCVILGIRHAFQRHHIRELGIFGNDANALGGIHG